MWPVFNIIVTYFTRWKRKAILDHLIFCKKVFELDLDFRIVYVNFTQVLYLLVIYGTKSQLIAPVVCLTNFVIFSALSIVKTGTLISYQWKIGFKVRRIIDYEM